MILAKCYEAIGWWPPAELCHNITKKMYGNFENEWKHCRHQWFDMSETSKSFCEVTLTLPHQLNWWFYSTRRYGIKVVRIWQKHPHVVITYLPKMPNWHHQRWWRHLRSNCCFRWWWYCCCCCCCCCRPHRCHYSIDFGRFARDCITNLFQKLKQFFWSL